MQEHTGAPLSAMQPPEDGDTTPATSRVRILRWYVIAAVVVFIIDQTSKAWALRALEGEPVVRVVGDVIGLRLIRNSGAAFSIGSSMTWLMTLVAMAVTLAILAVIPRIGSVRWSLALGMLLGGSLGNLFDRFFREPGPLRGHVIDFIDYGGLFVGNTADIGIVGGAGLLLWLVFTNIGIDGSHPQHASGQRHAKEDNDE